MGAEQKLGAYQKLFPQSEIKTAEDRLLVRHNLDKTQAHLKQAFNPILYSHQLAKSIFNIGGGFDFVFSMSKKSQARREATEFPDTHYVCLVANDGTVHQIRTMDQQFPDNFYHAVMELPAEKPVVFVDGFVQPNDRGGADYYMTPKNDPNENALASMNYVSLFKKIFWYRKEDIKENIQVTVALADPENPQGPVTLATSYGNDTLTIVMGEQEVLALAESMKRPFRGMTDFRDIRNTQVILPSINNPLGDF